MTSLKTHAAWAFNAATAPAQRALADYLALPLAARRATLLAARAWLAMALVAILALALLGAVRLADWAQGLWTLAVVTWLWQMWSVRKALAAQPAATQEVQ